MAELVPIVVVLVVGVLLLAALVLRLRGPLRRFAEARAGLRDEVRTGAAQLRALAYARGTRHSHGVDSP
jgi:hypothetical protein